MSFVTSIKFTVLSSASSEAEIFNCLVPVKRHDTGEEGILLCSHLCQWPTEKLSKARWIEGCYTPETMKDDPRLLMGYHPNHLVSWSYNLKTKVVELQLHSSGVGLELPLPYNELSENSRLYKLINRIFSPCIVQEEEETVRAVFSLAVRLLERKRIDHSVLMGLGYWLQNKLEGNLHCHEGEWFLNLVPLEYDEWGYLRSPIILTEEGLIEGIHQTRIPLSEGVVVIDYPEEGFLRPEKLPIQGGVVEGFKPEGGFVPAWDLPYHYKDGVLTVIEERSEGFFVSVSSERPSRLSSLREVWDDYDEEL